jgi:prepilin-type N-terminal cleavage/methylation domain-containing protein
MNDRNPLQIADSRGFTLIEMLVTTAISSALLIILGAIVSQTTDGYALTQRSVNHFSQARAFLQLFDYELSLRMSETAMIHRTFTPSGPESSDQLAFVRTLPIDEQNPENSGDIATSCYYVAFVESSNKRMIPKLFRKILYPSETQDFMGKGQEAEFPEIDPTSDEPVIDCVLSFQAIPMYHNPETGKDEPWDESISLPPSYIEMIIRNIDESFSRRFTNQDAWNRLAISPTNSEQAMIRSVKQRISIGQ